MDFWNILLVVGLAQGIYLIVSLLVFNKSNVLQNRYISLLIFAACAHILFELSNELISYPYRIILRILSISSPLLIGPSLYFFFSHSLKENYKSTRGHIYHFVPFFILLAFLTLIELASNSISANNINNSLPIYIPIIELLKAVQLSAYLILSYQIINNLTKTKKLVKYQNNTKQILWWFSTFLLLIIIAAVLSSVYFVSIKFLGLKALVGSPKFIALLLIALIYSIAFMAVKYPMIVLSEANSLVIKRSPRYKTSSLHKEKIDSLKQTIVEYMEQESPFLNSELKIEALAKAVNIPTHHLSQILNQGFEKSFQNFINHYRVEEFKKRIIDPNDSHKTILAIALESGFSSKSSFNRIFKSHTGITPYEFKKLNATNVSQIRK